MKQNRGVVQEWIGLSEGGLVDNPLDNGGLTNRGITQNTYAAWRKKNKLPPASVRNITKEEAEEIIFHEYMRPVRFDDLPSGLDYMVADFSVNSGPAKAAKVLQQVLGFSGREVDGVIGVKTLAQVEAQMGKALIDAYADARMRFLRSLKSKNGWPTFGKGWRARVEGKLDGTQITDIGVRDRAYKLYKNNEGISPPQPVGPGKAPPSNPVGWLDALLNWLGQLLKGRTNA